MKTTCSRPKLSGPVLLCLAGLVGSSSAQRLQPPASPGLGGSKRDSIEVCMPAGQRAYLSRLRCADGQAPTFIRVGSVGSRTDFPENLTREQEDDFFRKLSTLGPVLPDGTDYHVVDAYELTCGPTKRLVYMDMYHCKAPPPAAAPPGLTLQAE